MTNAVNMLLDKLVETVEQYKELFPQVSVININYIYIMFRLVLFGIFIDSQNNPPKSLSIIVSCITVLLQLKKSEEKPVTVLLPAVTVLYSYTVIHYYLTYLLLELIESTLWSVITRGFRQAPRRVWH